MTGQWQDDQGYDVFWPGLRPLRASEGRPSTAPIVTLHTEGKPPIRATVVRPRLTGLNGTHTFSDGAEFWAWLATLRREGRLLLVCGDPNRDLAVVGTPEGAAWHPPGRQRDPLDCDCDGDVAGKPLNRPEDSPVFMGRLVRGKRTWQIVGVGNWHPEGHYCYHLSHDVLAEWVDAYVAMIDAHDLGPEVKLSLAQQAMRSLSRHVALSGTRANWALGHHTCEPLHRFEYEGFQAQAPYRQEPNNTPVFDILWAVDFTAHYLAIMSSVSLPGEARGWWPEGCDLNTAHWWAVNQHLVADVTTHDRDREHPYERKIVTSIDWAEHEIIEVHRAAAYTPTTDLQSWARHLFDVRMQCSPEMQPVAKGIGVSLWGQFARRSRTVVCTPDDNRSPITPDMMAGRGRVWATDGVGHEYDSADKYCITDPAAFVPGRKFSIGTFMLQHGRRRMEDLIAKMPEGSVVAGHTDSLWTTQPIPGVPMKASHHERKLGGLVLTKMRNVQWRNGVRYVDGKVDAAPGQARPMTLRYADFDDPRQVVGSAIAEARQ